MDAGCLCVSVRVDLESFIHRKRIILKCDTCGRLWPLYHQWIHRLDPLPPSIPGSADSSSDDLAESYSFTEWIPWLIFGIGGALGCLILFVVVA